MLKIAYENIVVLHHQVIGRNWKTAHEWMEEIYEAVQKCGDDLTETALMLGYREMSIADAVLAFQGDVLTAEPRDKSETYMAAQNILRTLCGMIEAAKNITPPDVQNRLDEYAYELNLTANYKLARALEDRD
jgi:DNA-binding ferritin-like protein